MGKKFVHTCYGCEHYYTDKDDKYPRKHCDIVNHWECERWQNLENEEVSNAGL